MSATRSRFCRCTTKFNVSGSPAARTRRATASFSRVATGKSADAVGVARLHVLQAELDVIEPGARQRVQPRRIEQDPGGDEVAVHPQPGGAPHQHLQIAAHGRFAAGEMQLQHAERRRLVEHAKPGFGVQFAAGALQVQRVGAIGALQRAAMRQFGNQPQRRLGAFAGQSRIAPRSARSCSRPATSRASTSRGASNRAARASMMAPSAALPVDQPQNLHRVCVRHEQPFRGQHHPAVAHAIEAEFHAAAKRRDARLRRSCPVVGHEGAGRNEAGGDIGVMQRIELRPQDIAFERSAASTAACCSSRACVRAHIGQREIARRAAPGSAAA